MNGQQQQQQQPPQTSLISSASSTNIEAERVKFYKRCTDDELRGFVKARLQGRELADELKDANLQEQLLHLDRRTTFPVMDMPKDIRLLLYEELLKHGSRKHSQILATSRTIRDEAQGFLDKSVTNGSTYLMRIHSNQTDDGERHSYCIKDCSCKPERPVTTSRHGLGPAAALGPARNITKELGAFPAIPASATTMILDIVIESKCKYKKRDPWEPSELINRQLYLLATVLQASNIKSLSVRLIAPRSMRDQPYYRMLWPLSCLGSNITVSLSGVPTEHIQRLLKFQLDSSYKLTALSGWHDVQAAIEYLTGLVEKSELKGTGVHFLPALVAGMFNMSDRYTEVHYEVDDPRSPEAYIEEAVGRAKYLLLEPKWRDVEVRAKEAVQRIEGTGQ